MEDNFALKNSFSLSMSNHLFFKCSVQLKSGVYIPNFSDYHHSIIHSLIQKKAEVGFLSVASTVCIH